MGPNPKSATCFLFDPQSTDLLLWATQENVCVLSFRRSPVADVMEDVRSKTFTLFFEVIDGWVLNHFHVDESIDSTQYVLDFLELPLCLNRGIINAHHYW